MKEIVTEDGVRIRNIQVVPPTPTNRSHSFTFEALINGEWWPCSQPCGNWSYVRRRREDEEPCQFSVPVGWWELDRIHRGEQ